jgi:Domain of unknown function (DUF4386)
VASPRAVARAAGVLYLVTHVTSVGALVLYGPVLNDPAYVVGPGADARVLVGALLEVMLAMAIVGTAVALFPVVKRENEGIALGYVGLRTLEAATIVVGVVSVLAVVTLRQQHAGFADADGASLVTVGRALVAVHDWTFLVGPNFVLGTNTVLLALLLYRSRLVPRFIPMLGLIGGPLVFAVALGVQFGLYEQVSPIGAVAAVPAFAWELALAFWLIIKGLNPAPSAQSSSTGAAAPERPT